MRGLPSDPSDTDRRELSRTQVAQIRGPSTFVQPGFPFRIDQLAGWIARVWKHPAAAWWAGGQHAINDAILDRIRDELGRTPKQAVRPAVRKAWDAYLDYADSEATKNRVWRLQQVIRKAGWSEAVADNYVACFAPSLALDHIGRGPVPPCAASKMASSDLVRLDVKYENQVLCTEVPDDYLPSVIPKLRAQLERAETLESKYGSSTFICSIEPDEGAGGDTSIDRTWRLSGRVVAFVGLFRRLAGRSPALAHAELQTWPAQSQVFTRLRIWALGNLTFAPPGEFAEALLALDHALFWPFHGERDLLLGLSRRWSRIDRNQRRRLEQRLRAGPPRPKGQDREEHCRRAAYNVLSRLHWLHRQGCEFAFDLDAITEKLRTTIPQWQPDHADRAAESRDARTGTVHTNTDYSSIESLPPARILERLEEQSQTSHTPFINSDPFLGLSEERPNVAIQALIEGYDQGHFGPVYWNTFLRTDLRASDGPEFTIKILDALLNLSDSDFDEIVYQASDWFEHAIDGCLFSSEPRCATLWSKFTRVLGLREEPGPSEATRDGNPARRTLDWSTAATASPTGNLAELMVKLLPDSISDARSPGAGSWFRHLEKLLALPADSRRYALVVVAQHLDWFFAVDSEWTTKHVLSVLDQQPQIGPDCDAIWAGFFRSPRTGPALFARLKPQLLALTVEGSDPQQRHSELLAGILLAHWRPTETGEQLISDEEMRTAILNADDTFRHFLLWTLRRWSNKDEDWNSAHIVEFLSKAWPRQKRIRTAQTSGRLCELALAQTTGFPAIARIVTKLVAKASDARLVIVGALSDLEEVEAGSHPREVVDLLHAFLPDQRARWPYSAGDALAFLKHQHPSICRDPRFIELDGRT